MANSDMLWFAWHMLVDYSIILACGRLSKIKWTLSSLWSRHCWRTKSTEKNATYRAVMPFVIMGSNLLKMRLRLHNGKRPVYPVEDHFYLLGLLELQKTILVLSYSYQICLI